jgi:hypothetical protein
VRISEIASISYANLAGGNIGTSNANSRIQGISSDVYIMNGNVVGNNPFIARGLTGQLVVGQAANTANATMVAGCAITGFVQVNRGSSANTIFGVLNGFTTNGATANIVSYTGNALTGSSSNVSNYMVQFLHPSNTGILNAYTANTARAAPNYYAFLNDDNLAKVKLGSVEAMHMYTSNVAISSGNITVSKTAGQTQQVYMTANVDNVTFSNFVTRTQTPGGTQVNQTDTVSLIIQQGATPYAFTLPAGNSQIRYANGVSTVTASANTTTIIDVVGVYNYNTSAVNYLVTVNPAFS